MSTLIADQNFVLVFGLVRLLPQKIFERIAKPDRSTHKQLIISLIIIQTLLHLHFLNHVNVD